MIAQCKICRAEIDIAVGEELKNRHPTLIRMATCNTCYDYFHSRRQAEEKLKRIGWHLARYPAAAAALQPKVERLVATFCVSIAGYRRREMRWDDNFVAHFMAKPEHAPAILKRIAASCT